MYLSLPFSLPSPFLGARERAQDRAAQSNLRNALTSAKVHYTDEEAYTAPGAATTVLPANLTAIEPSLNFLAAGALAVTDPANTVRFLAEGNTVATDFQEITFYAVSASGNTFCVRDVATNGTDNPGTYYASSDVAAITTFTKLNCAGTEW